MTSLEFFVVWAMVFAIVSSLLSATSAYTIGQNDIMREAYKRGHAVKCLGQTGYHWECKE